MTSRDSIAEFPSPAYTCKQFSSYDRASTSADKLDTWFANGDASQFLRQETNQGRKEWVMMDAEGPGAIVRIWSANPKGKLRFYLDGKETPAWEGDMNALLGGKAGLGAVTVDEPLSHTASRGWNLYLPIPYAKQCKVTADQEGFYYQINYRTYEAGTEVEAFDPAKVSPAAITAANAALSAEPPACDAPGDLKPLAPGESRVVARSPGASGAFTGLAIRLPKDAIDQDFRSLVVSATFDGEQTVWSPVGDFFGTGIGLNAFHDWYRSVGADGAMRSAWVMPYQKSGEIVITNVGQTPIRVAAGATNVARPWTDRSMHFHATWRHESPISTRNGAGTEDWNYLSATGKGLYVGDTLGIVNPVEAWWGEGDEKIYVDSESFPSHFGTGTEDYYGYAWCCSVPFVNPFHSQPRADGRGKHNWGHTTNSRVRLLDGVPFTKDFRFDMEVWHWAQTEVGYAVTTFWYAMPGATTNRKPAPEEAAKPISQPPPLAPPYKLAAEGGKVIEFEELTPTSKSPGVDVEPQDMSGFRRRTWSGETHLWGRAKKVKDQIEFQVPCEPGIYDLTLYATNSWDYGTFAVTVNSRQVGEPIDFFSGQSGKVVPTGPISLGNAKSEDGHITIRFELVGANDRASGTRSFFGLDCIVLTPKKTN
jgi:hypothetical protein